MGTMCVRYRSWADIQFHLNQPGKQLKKTRWMVSLIFHKMEDVGKIAVDQSTVIDNFWSSIYKQFAELTKPFVGSPPWGEVYTWNVYVSSHLEKCERDHL